MTAKKKQNAVEETAAIDTVEEIVAKGENTFTKAQLLSAKRFTGRQDLLNALLDKNQKYTVKTVEEMIEKYMKGRVN